jgi:hypothetical protein
LGLSLLLGRERQIEHKSAATDNSTHQAPLTRTGPELEFAGLKALHAKIFNSPATGRNANS